jgi:hypothetical protein
MSSRFHSVVFASTMVAAGCGGEATEPLEASREPVSATCSSNEVTSGFVSQNFERQSGTFQVSFEATPQVALSDALTGLSLGTAGSYRDLAAIVRFNPSGFMDARNGDRYEAVSNIAYSAGVTRLIHMSVDLLRRTYSASVDGQLLARDFAFRSEQSSALALDALATKVDEGGALAVCNLDVQPTSSCASALPGQGFVNTSLPPASPAFSVTFSAIPRAANMDGVMGISAGAATSFPALAGAIRFSPSGVIDALNGSSYAVIDPASYTPDSRYSFVIVADAVNHNYSLVGPGDRITRNLAFRTQQAGLSAIGNFAHVSDSAAGALTVCDVRGGGAEGAEWIHDADAYGAGRYSLATSNDRVLLSDAKRTAVLDPMGAVAREIPYGGSSVTDADGNLYLLGKFEESYDGGTGTVYPTAGGGNIYISKYDASFSPVYTRVEGTTADGTVKSPSADDHGHVAFVLVDSGTSTAVKLQSDGETLWRSDYPASAIALDSNGEMAVGVSGASTMTLSRLDGAGTPRWTRAFPTEGVELEGVVFDSQGNVAFWGGINGQIELDGAPFIARSSENGPLGLFGLLGADGSPRFVRTTSMQSIRRVVADRTGHLIVVGTHVNGFAWLLDRYDDTGERTHAWGGDQLLPPLALGFSGDVAIDSRGAVYWQFTPLHGGTSLNYLAKLRPF